MVPDARAEWGIPASSAGAGRDHPWLSAACLPIVRVPRNLPPGAGIDWPGDGDRYRTTDLARLAGVRSRALGGDERRPGGPALSRPAADPGTGRSLGPELPG